MIRKIIKIDEEKCNGCGDCIEACHEGAIKIIDGKARLVRDDYCDGLGDCLPVCITGAITFEEREAEAYDEKAVLLSKQKTSNKSCVSGDKDVTSKVRQWPIQVKLVSPNASYLADSNLVIAADCTAYAYADFHRDFLKSSIVLIACPKLDDIDYSEKLALILQKNNIKKITVVRMEVPCCTGIENATKKALQKSGRIIPWQIITISTDGKILTK
ncbi:MAG: 4Fe-4S binding protein [Clostridia bacterium]|nr:4Fe-4S binding protein [Clostridia bacterium]